MRSSWLVLGLATLGSCAGEPGNNLMREIAVRDANFPKDGDAEIRSIGRDAGGGWQGGQLEFELSASEQIVGEWRASLERDSRFYCRRLNSKQVCSRSASDKTEGVAVAFVKPDATRITKWTIK